MMPPFTMELRQGWETWLYRSEFTSGRWEDTWCSVSADYQAVRNVLQRQYPDHVIRWPEQQNLRWEDC